MAVQYSFQLPGYPGYWYEFYKSIVSHSPVVPASAYTFDSVDTLPGEAAGDGWTP